MGSSPLFSIITVTWNAAPVLSDTIASLRGQTSTDFEWIVVDGASQDATLEVVGAHHPDVLCSEPDRGIFDAMNKAVSLANGSWLYFLNAGDCFSDARVLEEVAAKLKQDELASADILFGDVIYCGKRGNRLRRFNWLRPWKLKYGDLCHQAVFARRELFERVGEFNLAYKFNADYDWLLRAQRALARFYYLPRLIARFDDSGAHVKHAQQSAIERRQVVSHFTSAWKWKLFNTYLKCELKLRRFSTG
jgi:glycosyltransferase involved in cell wall biosynthesis